MQSHFNALVLAAGVGSRLGSLTAERPKALLPLGGRTTLLDHTLELLLAAPGLRITTIVGGHRFEVLEAHLAERYPNEPRVNAVFNRHYASVNNIGSFVAGETAFSPDAGTFLFNSDIVYAPEILFAAQAQAARSPNQSFLVVNNRLELGDEEMKVIVDAKSGKVTRINKNLPPAEAVGEYTGILYLAPADAAKCLASARNLLEAGKTTLYYEDAIAAVLSDLHLTVLFTNGHWCTEIDTEQDYEHALTLVGSAACG